ncbi:hypothetical protein P4O66_022122, partial [Electrophorus voltai]
ICLAKETCVGILLTRHNHSRNTNCQRMQQEPYSARGLLAGAECLALLLEDTEQVCEGKRRADHMFADMMNAVLRSNMASMGDEQFTYLTYLHLPWIGSSKKGKQEEGHSEGLMEDLGDSGSDTMVVNQPSMDQDLESYNEGQKFYYDLRLEAGSEHILSSHQNIVELPLEDLSEVVRAFRGLLHGGGSLICAQAYKRFTPLQNPCALS